MTPESGPRDERRKTSTLNSRPGTAKRHQTRVRLREMKPTCHASSLHPAGFPVLLHRARGKGKGTEHALCGGRSRQASICSTGLSPFTNSRWDWTAEQFPNNYGPLCPPEYDLKIVKLFIFHAPATILTFLPMHLGKLVFFDNSIKYNFLKIGILMDV